MADNNKSNTWIFVAALAIGCAVAGFLNGCGNAVPTTTPTSVDRSSFEHRYAKERVKLEGYSDREATQAADAIIKFHNAQQNR